MGVYLYCIYFYSLIVSILHKKRLRHRGAWVAQSAEPPTLAQVMISWFVSWSPASGSVLTAQSLEPASDSVTPLCPFPTRTLCLSQK